MAVSEISPDSILPRRGMRVEGMGWTIEPNWQYELMEYLFVFSVLMVIVFFIYSKYYRAKG